MNELLLILCQIAARMSARLRLSYNLYCVIRKKDMTNKMIVGNMDYIYIHILKSGLYAQHILSCYINFNNSSAQYQQGVDKLNSQWDYTLIFNVYYAVQR